ncbi:MAG TPA: nucleoside hydrolase [Roseiarcus sp.]|nr:nucleoside hydrolase [Roseiarcus sp.]
MVRPLVLDVDTGTDDAVAVMLAALRPELNLLGVTTVNGNVEVARCTDNTLRVLDWIGRGDIPVHEGLARPIVREDFPTPRALKRDAKVHLDVLPLPEARTAKRPPSAPEFLVRTFAERPGAITLVAVGPLSNVAAALALDPQFPKNVSELMIMGGAIDKSNVTPSAEFNIWADPEAAAIVLAAPFAKTTMVPLDATHQALISRDQCAALRALGTPAGKAAAEFIEFRIVGYQANQPTGVPDTAPVHDALCIAALIEPEVIDTRFLNVVVETRGDYTIGRTVVDHEKRTTRPPNCHVALNADRARFFNFLRSTFARS